MKQYNLVIENDNFAVWDKLKEISKRNKSNIRVELFNILQKHFSQETEQNTNDKLESAPATEEEK